MKTIITPILALVLLALTGCVTTKNFATADFKQPSLITQPVPAISITAEFVAHRDQVTSGSTVLYSFPSGELAKQLFTGGPGAPASLVLLSSQLTIESRDEFPLPIFHTNARYSISCVLEHDGKKVPLSATAVGKTSLNAAEAGRQAVERALIDISKQAQAVL